MSLGGGEGIQIQIRRYQRDSFQSIATTVKNNNHRAREQYLLSFYVVAGCWRVRVLVAARGSVRASSEWIVDTIRAKY